MAKTNKTGAADPLAFGKQLWDMWTDAAQQALRGQMPTEAFTAPMDAFSRMGAGPGVDVTTAFEKLGEHGRQFMEMLQSFGRGGASGGGATDVAGWWRENLGKGNPLLDAMRQIAGEGARGFEQMVQEFAPMLAKAPGGFGDWLGLPTFGYSRERQARWQDTLRLHGEYLEKLNAYNGLLMKAASRGFEYFERRLHERSAPGKQLESGRALYDLWIDAAEDAYAEVALSPEFRTAYGEMVNAQMRLKSAVSSEVEHATAAMGIPTRSELDGTHRKVHDLQREVRELRRALRASQPAKRAESTVVEVAAAAPPSVKVAAVAVAPSKKAAVVAAELPSKKAPVAAARRTSKKEA